MPSQVLRACEDILTEQTSFDHDQAVGYLETMRKGKRLVYDTWG